MTMTELLGANTYLEQLLEKDLPFDLSLDLSTVKSKISGDITAFQKARDKESKKIEAKYKEAIKAAKGDKNKDLTNIINSELSITIQKIIDEYKIEADFNGLKKIPLWKFNPKINEDLDEDFTIKGNQLYHMRFFIDQEKISKEGEEKDAKVPK